MCGIAGYIGKSKAFGFLLDGLEKLEYRGYDSAGIAIVQNNEIRIAKAKGKLENLILKSEHLNFWGNIGIGHTRWATHGKPDEINSHPHLSQNGKFAIVHNGIIENYLHLKEELKSKGFEFKSETDTEVVPNLVQYFYKDNVLDAFIKAISMLKGSYALGFVSSYEPDKIYATSKESPLILGIGENENYIASDIQALAGKTNKIIVLQEGEFAEISKNNILITDNNRNPITKEIIEINLNESVPDKQGFDFFMLKEIMEQPKAVKDTIMPLINNGLGIKLNESYFGNLNKIFIVGCGSAYHAGQVGKKIIEEYARMQTIVELASEFKYADPIIGKGDLIIFISQSGETSDTLAALKLAKEKGAEVLSIINVRESSIARESDNVIYTNAGPEIAVATTKGYLTQIMVLYLLAIHIAFYKKRITEAEHKSFVKQMIELSDSIENIFKDISKINELSKEFLTTKNMFFIGRGLDSLLAMEGALKLKEISYINAQSYAAGELKHGTISLIEEGSVVIALCTEKMLEEKMLGNIKEVKARGATVVIIKQKEMKELDLIADRVINVEGTNKYFSGIFAIIYLQLFAYYVSYNKGLDVDKPRNLAKSVTVE